MQKRNVDRLYLLCLQCQLDEYLLQFLIHKVDAELFKAVFLKKKQQT